jgi:voltage-gated potassium channel
MKTPRVPKTVRIAATLVGPVVLTVGYFTLPLRFFGRDHKALSWTVLGGLIVLMAAGMVLLTRRALGDGPGNPGAGILLLSWASLLLFAAGYWALSTIPGEFVGLTTRVDALYFTVITLATVGYGDITPAGQTSRVVVMIQLLYSFAFLAAGLTATTTRIRKKLVRKLSV